MQGRADQVLWQVLSELCPSLADQVLWQVLSELSSLGSHAVLWLADQVLWAGAERAVEPGAPAQLRHLVAGARVAGGACG